MLMNTNSHNTIDETVLKTKRRTLIRHSLRVSVTLANHSDSLPVTFELFGTTYVIYPFGRLLPGDDVIYNLILDIKQDGSYMLRYDEQTGLAYFSD